MRGVLWKWLFTLGLIFWIALCVTDYYKKNIERHPEYVRSKYIEEDVIMLSIKKDPPALTFWKTLSMVLSVSALVYIKRSSSTKKYSKSNLMLTYPSQDDINTFSTSPRIYKNVPRFPTNKSYCTDLKNNQISADLYSIEPRRILGSNKKNTIPAIIGVQLVQKKLENLERSVASLKQRHQGSSSGIISGSPEFRKFLSNQSINPTSSDMSVISSYASSTSKVAGGCLVATNTSSEDLSEIKDHQVPQMLNSSTSTTTMRNSVVLNTNQVDLTQISSLENNSVNLSGKTEDSSWSTISEEDSSNNIESSGELEVSTGSPETNLPLSTITEASKITEILQIQDSFSLTSKISGVTDLTDTKSLQSLQSTMTDSLDILDYEDNVQVPGSTLVSTSGNTSICSSSTIISSSMFFDETSCCSFDDDVLFNTLD